MTARRADDEVMPFPPLQHQGMDWLALMHCRHTMHALFEAVSHAQFGCLLNQFFNKRFEDRSLDNCATTRGTLLAR